jgi:hypothetical protein
MGQDTNCYIGVSYECKFTYENILIIRKLLSLNDDIIIYMSYGDCDDECITVSDALLCDEVINIINTDYIEKDFINIVETIILSNFHYWIGNSINKIYNRTLTFQIKLIECNARNLSRRRVQQVCHDTCIKPDILINNITDAQNKFISIGIDKDNININYMFNDN